MNARQPLPASVFNMLRCIIVVIHSDLIVDKRETEFFRQLLAAVESKYDVTDAHRKIFEDDFKTPQEIATLLPRVSDAETLGMLIYFSELLVVVDQDLAHQERSLIKTMYAMIENDGQTGEIMKQIRLEVLAEWQARPDKNDGEDPAGYALRALIRRLAA
jgi:hypothetical protein